ncbi:MAG: hypothetical protein NUV65_00810 [Candidatus Roizmanbacteria bacterium]|nr:hypothetical protein [Candidatus Roizmanbacteria bacterium]
MTKETLDAIRAIKQGGGIAMYRIVIHAKKHGMTVYDYLFAWFIEEYSKHTSQELAKYYTE